MNLHGETPTLFSKLSSFAGRYRVPLAALAPSTVDRLIVLGDGTPDDYAVFLISHHLNGSDTSAIIKPEGKTGTSTFELIRVYLSAYRSLKGLLFVLDQEEETPDAISSKLERQVKKSKLAFACRNEPNTEPLRVYDCALGERQLCLILVLNGLPEIPTSKHTVEDHFLKAAAGLKLLSLPENISAPKSHWRTKVSSKTKEAVFEKLVESKRLTETTFPQQMRGLEHLKAIGK